MKLLTQICLVLLLWPGIHCAGQSNGTPPAAMMADYQLEFLEIKQLNGYQSNRFDLSGLTYVDGRLYAVADKGWNNYIYEIAQNPDQDNAWEILNTITLGIIDLIDLEGIDYCNGSFFLINEMGNKVYELKSDGTMAFVQVNFYLENEDPEKWLSNAGYEGVAINCEQQILYLAKERQPRMIYEVDLKYGKIINHFDIPQDESNDFSSVVYKNGYLYVLERNGNYVKKINLETKMVVAKANYRHIASAEQGKLYEPSKYGMAEAMILTDEEIWIGLDNNGLEVSDYAKEKYGLSGNQPSIIKFVRPEGF